MYRKVQMDPRWLAAREAKSLTRIDSLRKGQSGINSMGRRITLLRPHGAHAGVFFMWNGDSQSEEVYAGCAEVLLDK
jgi:hypothetical protein